MIVNTPVPAEFPKEEMVSASCDKPLNITVMFERLGPYHAARLNAAAACCHLTAIEVQRTDATYAWDELDQVGFSRISIFRSSHDRLGLKDLKDRIEAALATSNPDAVAIHGWSEPAALLALRWCRAHRVPAIVMSESSERDAPRKRMGEWVKNKIVRHFSAGLVGGSDHRDYLSKLGVSAEKCFLGYDVVDNAYFQLATSVARQDSERIRRELRLPHRYFLASCRFIEKKNITYLTEAYSQYRHEFGDAAWDLIILGDGPLREQVDAMIDSLKLRSHIHLPGFRQYAELPSYYALASSFVHASTVEQWGLVINEAMACGLPVIISERCGCARELVDESNGWTFDPYDVDQLACCFAKATELSDDQISRLRNASLQKIEEWSPERFAKGLVEAARVAIANDPLSWSGSDKWFLLALAWRRRSQLKNSVAH